MLSKNLLGLAILIPSVILLGGCASVCTSIPSNNPKIEKIGPSFFNKVEISNSNATKLSNGSLQATSVMSNLSSDPQLVQYRFIWFNNDGTPLGNATPWTPLQIYPGLSRTVATIAPNPNTTKFHVEACMLKPTNNIVTFYRD